MRVSIFLSLCLVGFSASSPVESPKIVGGPVTTIDHYPAIAALLYNVAKVDFRQSCGGSILNQRTILTAAHCLVDSNTAAHRVRVGSTWANSGGVVHNVETLILHPEYLSWRFDFDIAVVHTASFITYNDVVQAATIAGPNYNIIHYESVWAAGWGRINPATNERSEQLRHVEMPYIDQDRCKQLYAWVLTDNMLCAGDLVDGGVSQCQGDSGGPLYHRGTVVGVCSFVGSVCGNPATPSVNARVSRFTSWIQENAYM